MELKKGPGHLGVMYALGQGMPVDYQKAFQWTAVSAIRGDQESLRIAQSLKPYLTADQAQAAQVWIKNWKPRETHP